MTKPERGNSSPLSSQHSDSGSIKHSPTGSAVLPTCVEQSGDEEQQDTKIDITITNASPAPSRKSSLKIRRGSSKRKKVASKTAEGASSSSSPMGVQQTEVLNNCKPLPQSQSSIGGDEVSSSGDAIRKVQFNLIRTCCWEKSIALKMIRMVAVATRELTFDAPHP